LGFKDWDWRGTLKEGGGIKVGKALKFLNLIFQTLGSGRNQNLWLFGGLIFLNLVGELWQGKEGKNLGPRIPRKAIGNQKEEG